MAKLFDIRLLAEMEAENISSSPRDWLRYVFNISDTHMVRGGRTPNLC